ncbi:helix-turn-helix transcriptional regulator [Labilibacter sediminis]|nr:helix-turn-helix transcriptional regulator [Labilibacter sediminis]
MADTNTIHVHLQEGTAQNYFEILKKSFGGATHENYYLLDQGPFRVKMSSYDIMGELEMIINESECYKPIVFERTPDNDPDLIHINLIMEGHYTQAYNEELKQMEAGSAKGIFLYDGQFPIKAEFPANVNLKWVGFKLRIPELKNILTDAQKVMIELFGHDQEIAYHVALPPELDRLLNDLFQYRELTSGQKPMMIARGIEIFTNLMTILKDLIANKSLNGLHVEDFKRLNAVKKKLTRCFDQKITIEDLANEFGVSASKLKRDFKQLFDTTIYQFYALAKMDEAFRRLKSGQYSVTEVGYDLGYQNLSKFAEMFKKVKGISPKEVIKLADVV